MRDWAGIPCIQVISPGVEVPTLKCLEAVFLLILRVAISLSVLALFLMFLIGGFRYLTSGGDPKAAAGAQQTMTYGVMGIALMALAFIIFRIIEVFTGITVTEFVIPNL